MAKNDGNTFDFSKEIDQLLLLMEEVLKVSLKITQPKKQHPEVGEQPEAPDAKEEEKKLKEAVKALKIPEPAIEKRPITELDQLMATFTGLRRNIVSKMQEQSRVNEAEAPVVDRNHEKAEHEIVSGLNDLDRMVTDTQKVVATAVVATEGIKRNSVLKNLGERLIQLDEKRDALSYKIRRYFISLPGRVKEGFASLVIGSLQDITTKMGNLTKAFNNCIHSEVEELPDIKSISDNINRSSEVEEIADDKSIPDDKSLPEKIKDLLEALEKDISIIKSDVKTFEDRLKESEKTVGIRTELDPKVGVFETLNGNEKSGLKTVSSVKEEIEDVTLTDYSHHEEEAYHEGFDPDPDVATVITDEEWADEYDYDYER